MILIVKSRVRRPGVNGVSSVVQGLSGEARTERGEFEGKGLGKQKLFFLEREDPLC